MINIKLWIDDVRPAPDGYVWYKSTDEALRFLIENRKDVELIDLDHDSGDFYKYGGDYIRILDEIERLSKSQTSEGLAWRICLKNDIVFRIHSMNSVGAENMRQIIQKNGWKEVF